MKKKHISEQIIQFLGKVEKCVLKISDACRPHQITEQTYYRWKRKYGGMEVSEARRLSEIDQADRLHDEMQQVILRHPLP